MSELVLYQQYGWDEAVSLFGSKQHAQILCDGQWVICPEVILCFATLGNPTTMSHFESASRFWWISRTPPIPKEVIAARNWHPTIHHFARNDQRQTYLYLGKSGPSHQQSYRRSDGDSGAEFDLCPAIPSEVWQSLGGYEPGDLNHGRIDAALHRLRENTTTADRMEILRDVAEYWHGPIRTDDGISEGELTGKEIPSPLRSWYRLAGRRKEIMSGQNILLLPDKLEIKDGRMLFYGENQWCYEWATQPTGNDPPVYGRYNATDPWQPEGMSLSEFLIQVCLFEAVMCHCRYGASSAWIDADLLNEIAKTMRPLPIGRWGWCGTEFWTDNGAFAFVADNGESQGRRGYSIWIGAKTEHPLAFSEASGERGLGVYLFLGE